LYCPTNAISVDHDEINEIKKLLSNKDDINVAIVAPSTRAALGEEFNHNYGLDVTRKIYTSLRKLGFEYIFDVNYGADMTVMEESCELLNHLQIPPIQNNRYGFKLQMTKKKNTPLFTSCCPG
jgi:iron only hydrogenase large subunit-like protein